MSDVRARVAYDPNYACDAIVIYRPGREILEWVNGRAAWRPIDERIDLQEPPVDKLTICDEEVLRALYEALAEHFGGTGRDARALRKDYEHEKDRVDKLIDAVTSVPTAISVNGETIIVARPGEMEIDDRRKAVSG